MDEKNCKQCSTLVPAPGAQRNILLLMLTLSFTAASMLASTQPIWVNLPVNVIVPILIMVFCKLVFFERLKLTTLTVLRVLIVLAVFNVMPRQWFVNLVLIALVVNILEATFTDIVRYKRYFNGITGLALAASVWFLKDNSFWVELPQMGKFAHIYEANAYTAAGTICWIVAYTIWNWIFVTNEFSDSIAKLHVGILASPIVGCLVMWNPGYWLVFRASSLAFGGCFQIFQKEYLEQSLQSDSFSKFVTFTKKTGVQIVLMIISLACIAGSGFLR